MAGERNNTHITWSSWSLVLKTDARIHNAVVRAGLMHAGICARAHTHKGSAAPEYLTSHDSKIIVNNSESADIHAATQHKTNPPSDDDNCMNHWAIERKGPDRGVEAVPDAERRRRTGELASERWRVWIGNAESSSAQGGTLGGQRRRSGPRCGGGLLESRECQYL